MDNELSWQEHLVIVIGEDWIKHFEAKNYQVSTYAKQLLRSPDFQPTKDIEYEVVIIKSEEFADVARPSLESNLI